MSEFSSMLRYLRLRAGLGQSELADALKIGKSTISMYELGRREPEFEMEEAIADYFNVSLDFLRGREKSPPPNNDDGLSEEFKEVYRRLAPEQQKVLRSLLIRNAICSTQRILQ